MSEFVYQFFVSVHAIYELVGHSNSKIFPLLFCKKSDGEKQKFSQAPPIPRISRGLRRKEKLSSS